MMQPRSAREWWDAIIGAGALWRYPSDPRAPHVVLRSGRHSDGFINILEYLSAFEHLENAAVALAHRIKESLNDTPIDWVFGSPVAGIPLATVVGPLVGATNMGCVEKAPDGGLICRSHLEPGARVIRVEEMTTSGGTAFRLAKAILEKNPSAIILPQVASFLIRCPPRPVSLEDMKLIPVVDLTRLNVSFEEWEAAECRLCKAGSRPIENCKQVWRDLLKTMSNPTHPVPQR